MSTETSAPETESGGQQQLEASTYEIIRGRLASQAKDLRGRLELLNAARKDVFGSIDTELLRTERITTDHNCVPRDMVSVGGLMLFGYNVKFGLKTETDVADVFSVYRRSPDGFQSQGLELLQDAQFQRDFKEVYKYYKSAQFSKFFVRGASLFMVFQVGKTVADIKTLKWHIDGERLVYSDNRSDHEVRYPPQHEFQWKRTTRDQHHYGAHPHISIEDRVFVETVGGDLTIKVEDNTESGSGIYAEEVDNKDQTLDDAEIYYAIIGNVILLKIRPYQEKAFRYIVFNEKIQQAQRLDAIEHACVLLPDDHGLIFSNGYYLQSGESKTFGDGMQEMLFERRASAPNGEDYLYVFYNRQSGVYILLRYNLIEQAVETPIICHGVSFFNDGEMVCFRSQDEPQKHHAIQIWRTPYVGEDHVPAAHTDSFLYKVGNRDIVRGMAECHEILSLIGKDESYANLYVDLHRKAGDILDSYFWINQEAANRLSEPLEQLRDTAGAAIEEFEKVVRVRQATAQQTREVRRQTEELLGAAIRKRFDHIDDFVSTLAELRRLRGDIVGLRDLKYADEAVIEKLEAEVAETSERTGQRCVQFLLRDDCLKPYAVRIREQNEAIGQLEKVSDAKKLDQQIAAGSGELEMLIDIVSNLKIDDATQRTGIIDNISALFAHVNQARAALKNKTQDLLGVEGRAEFSSQMKLLNQSVVNYLDLSDSPEKCEEFLTKVMVQLEELEGRFAEFDEFVLQLTEKREEIYNAFETRKLGLVEARNRRAAALMSAAERILKGIHSRVDAMKSVNDIHGYFASDLMIEKVRDICRELEGLEDTVKVDDIQSRLKTIREDAVRQLKDRQDLFVDGQNLIKFGRHRFAVNSQALDLTTVMREDEMCLHLTGTNFFQPIDVPELNELRSVWKQEVVSETPEVYRGEYLAFRLFRELEQAAPNPLKIGAGDGKMLEVTAEHLHLAEAEERLRTVQAYMAPRYNEAYSKGVHDTDAAAILSALLDLRATIGMLRHRAGARAMAAVFWRHFCPQRQALTARLRGVGAVADVFPQSESRERYVAELSKLLAEFALRTGLFAESLAPEAAEYAYEELTRHDEFVVSRRAAQMLDDFHAQLKRHAQGEKFARFAAEVQAPAQRFQLIRDWARAFAATRNEEDLEHADELAALLMQDKVNRSRIVDGHVTRTLPRLSGSHPLLKGEYRLHYNQFLGRLQDHEADAAPRYQRYIELKRQIVDAARRDMKLSEFQPRVLTSFVRNRLIDEVYLPLVGDNLAKQIGTAGEQKRTDRMGLLLLVSPPGYGKTTLMEYIANRLGLIFMKINGPAIGHQVTSLDPQEAPNAAAREEVNKLNLALEMGDNVMIYVDDIQHCNPEFLQKFISLCDAQRKIEGVYQGQTRTYDLRGRKVAVVMAGNPYTESGEKFQIPDMLSNRADIYNLGEIIGETQEAFELSYLENALTSNSTLNKLASRSQKDVYSVLEMAQTRGVAKDLEGSYSLEEVQEMVAVARKLLHVRDVVLKVNREYIRSAAQSDDYRTEPPFKLQGSYRNMNRIAERVAPIMNDEELEGLILSSYENDAQTLTSDTESNLLRLKELLGKLTDEEARRWDDIKRQFQKNVKLRGLGGDDAAAQMMLQLSTLGDGLDSIGRVLQGGLSQLQDSSDSRKDAASLIAEVAGLREGIEQLGGTLKPAAPGGRGAAAGLGEEAVREGGPLHKVVVQHKVPRSVLDVVRSQFDLMSNSLAPLLSASEAQRQEQRQIRDSIETCLKAYASLLEELVIASKKT